MFWTTIIVVIMHKRYGAICTDKSNDGVLMPGWCLTGWHGSWKVQWCIIFHKHKQVAHKSWHLFLAAKQELNRCVGVGHLALMWLIIYDSYSYEEVRNSRRLVASDKYFQHISHGHLFLSHVYRCRQILTASILQYQRELIQKIKFTSCKIEWHPSAVLEFNQMIPNIVLLGRENSVCDNNKTATS